MTLPAHYIAIVLCFFIVREHCAQSNQQVDSPRQSTTGPLLADTSSVNGLITLAQHQYNLGLYTEAVGHANAARTKAMAIKDHKGYRQALFLLTEIYLKQRDFQRAYQYLYDALGFSVDTNDSVSLARSYFLLGRYYRQQTILPQSMEAYIKALEIYEALHDEVGQALCLSNLGKFSSDLKDYPAALDYFNQSLAIFQKRGIIHEVYNMYQLIGDVHYRAGNYQESMDYHQLALKGGKDVGDKTLIAYSYDNIANVYVALNDFRNARQNFEQAVAISQETNDSYGLATTYNDMAVMFLKLGDQPSVLKYGKLSLNYAKASANRGIVRDANMTLYSMFKQAGQWSKALEHIEVVLALNDSIYNGEKTNLVNNARYDYDRRKQLSELEKRDIELKMHRAELEAKRRQMYLYLTLGLLGISVLVLLWRRNIHKQKVNQVLSEHNETIRKMNEGLEHEVSMRTHELQLAIQNLTNRNEDLEHFSYVLSHNVRAPIARLKGLLNILDKDNIKGEYNHDVIKKMEQSCINFDIIIHDLQNILSYQKKELQREEVDIKKEIDLVSWGLAEEIQQQDVKITHQLQEPKVFTVRTFLHSILYHLISNSIKYRSPERKPEVVLRSRVQNHHLEITIQDNGLGLDLQAIDPKKIFALYQRFHTHVEGKGLGLYLVKTQTEALGGTISVSSSPDEGALFTVSLPV